MKDGIKHFLLLSFLVFSSSDLWGQWELEPNDQRYFEEEDLDSAQQVFQKHLKEGYCYVFQSHTGPNHRSQAIYYQILKHQGIRVKHNNQFIVCCFEQAYNQFSIPYINKRYSSTFFDSVASETRSIKISEDHFWQQLDKKWSHEKFEFYAHISPHTLLDLDSICFQAMTKTEQQLCDQVYELSGNFKERKFELKLLKSNLPVENSKVKVCDTLHSEYLYRRFKTVEQNSKRKLEPIDSTIKVVEIRFQNPFGDADYLNQSDQTVFYELPPDTIYTNADNEAIFFSLELYEGEASNSIEVFNELQLALRLNPKLKDKELKKAAYLYYNMRILDDKIVLIRRPL